MMETPPKRNLVLFAIIQIGIVAIMTVVFIQSIVQNNSKPVSSVIPTKEIISNTLGLTEQWRRRININNYYDSVKMVIQDDQLFVYSNDNKLYAFNLITGHIDWVKEIWNVRYVTANNDGVYVDKQGQIFAFQTQTGNLLWTKTFYTGHGFLLDIYAKEDILEVYYSDVYILAGRTGEEQKKISYDTDWRSIFFMRENILYLTAGNYLSAYDTEINKNLWTIELDTTPIHWPLFVNGEIIVKAQEIYALKTDTGKILWHTPKLKYPQQEDVFTIDPNTITSNIALGNNIVYAIAFNNALVGFNAKTGGKIGSVEMSATNTTPVISKAQSEVNGYRLVAASDKYVAAYYGDSQELIVFERTDGTP